MGSQHFNSRVYVPGGVITNRQGDSLDLRELAPFLRTLLVTDGTVTKSLEAYFWEPIQVSTLHQNRSLLEAPSLLLGAEQGAAVIMRDVALRGEHSGNTYALASSILLESALTSDHTEQLLAGQIGIGELLRASGLETYREIVDFGRLTQDALSMGEAFVYRTYLIRMGGQPAIQITERFPLKLFS